MLNIKKLLAVMTCALVLSSAMSACSDKDEDDKSDGFTISEVDPSTDNNANNGSDDGEINSNPDVANREYEETLGVIAEEYDYYGLKYTVNKVSELEFEQYPGGKVLIVDLTLTNDSEYEYSVGAYANFEVQVDGEGETSEFITAQVMTITTRYYISQNADRQIFGIGGTPPIQPGETLTGFLPIALTSDIVDFETITLSFLPDNQAGVRSNITVDITPSDITPLS